jgi:hypothetical protein
MNLITERLQKLAVKLRASAKVEDTFKQ